MTSCRHLEDRQGAPFGTSQHQGTEMHRENFVRFQCNVCTVPEGIRGMHLSLSEVQVARMLHHEGSIGTGIPQPVERHNKGEQAENDGCMVNLAACF